MMFKNNRLKLLSFYYSSINRAANSTQEHMSFLGHINCQLIWIDAAFANMFHSQKYFAY